MTERENVNEFKMIKNAVWYKENNWGNWTMGTFEDTILNIINYMIFININE